MGRLAFVDYYCGRCESGWRIMDEGERRARPRPEHAEKSAYEEGHPWRGYPAQ